MEMTGQRSARGFTIIEMLAVLAIIGLMIGVSIPVFNIIGGDRGVRGDIIKLNGVLRLARQHAIMKRTYSYVVFVDDFAGVDDEHRHRAYAVLEGDADGPTTYVSPWHTLSKGIFFVDVNNNTPFSFGAGATNIDVISGADRRPAPYPDTGPGTENLRMLRYSPAGRCMTHRGGSWELTGFAHVGMAPGFIRPDNAVEIPPVNQDRAGSIRINSRTGLSSMRLVEGG